MQGNVIDITQILKTNLKQSKVRVKRKQSNLTNPAHKDSVPAEIDDEIIKRYVREYL